MQTTDRQHLEKLISSLLPPLPRKSAAADLPSAEHIWERMGPDIQKFMDRAPLVDLMCILGCKASMLRIDEYDVIATTDPRAFLFVGTTYANILQSAPPGNTGRITMEETAARIILAWIMDTLVSWEKFHHEPVRAAA